MRNILFSRQTRQKKDRNVHTSEVFLISIIDPPWEDQCEWHRMTTIAGPDCAVMSNLINKQTHTSIEGL